MVFICPPYWHRRRARDINTAIKAQLITHRRYHTNMLLSLSSTHPGLQLGDHPLALPLGEGLGLLQADGDLPDLNLQLFPQPLGVLVVVLLHAQLFLAAGQLVGQAVATVLSGATVVDVVIEVGLHGADIGLHATLVGGQGGHGDGQLVDAGTSVVQLVLRVLAGALRLWEDGMVNS